MFIGYRALNQKTRPNKSLLYRIDDLMDWLLYANCLSSIDFYIGYYQIEIRPRNEYKTA